MMPIGNNRSDTNICKYCTGAKKRSIGIVTAITIVIVILTVAAFFIEADKCSNTLCQEATRILQTIDFSADPCDDFYQFACGGFLKRARRNESFNIENVLKREEAQEYARLCSEEIRKDDHNAVKLAKVLFQECIDTAKVNRDGPKPIQEVLRKVGGWPVVEGTDWNATNFDWVKVTYQLRKSGYPFEIFFTVYYDEQHMLHMEVHTPLVKYSRFTPTNFPIDTVVDIVQYFGSKQSRDAIKKELYNADEFGKNVERYAGSVYTEATVDEYQRQFGFYIHIANFLNNILGSTVHVSYEDKVVFTRVYEMQHIMNVIARTPKRTVANYMAWKVVEQLLPYLPRDFLNTKSGDRDEFCLKEIDKVFETNPITVMHARKHTTAEKKLHIEQTLNDFKTETISLVEQLDVEDSDRSNILLSIGNIKYVIGMPGDYFSDAVLDQLGVEAVNTSTTFLGALAQATKYYYNAKYSQKSNYNPDTDFYRNMYAFTYNDNENVIYIPTSTVPYYFKSTYSKRASLAYLFMYPLLKVIVNAPDKAKEQARCIKDKLQVNAEGGIYLIKTDFLAQNITHAVNKNSKTVSGGLIEKIIEEFLGINYTPQQLFWINYPSCRAVSGVENQTVSADTERNIYLAALRNSPAFSEDFKCDNNSKMNPPQRCILF